MSTWCSFSSPHFQAAMSAPKRAVTSATPRSNAVVTSASLRPLRGRNFALVWSAALVSNIGSWMQTVAVGVFVTEVTGQAKWTGLVAAAAFVPIGFLSPVGGAMADRVDRRKWLLLTMAASRQR